MSRPSTFDLELFYVDFRDQRIESTLKTPGELNISKKVDFLVTLIVIVDNKYDSNANKA